MMRIGTKTITFKKLKLAFWKFRQRMKILLWGSPVRIKLGSRYVGKNEPVFIIAEIGINHNGDPKIARALIDKAAEAGVDCVKFQMRDLDSLYGNTSSSNPTENLGTQYLLDVLSKTYLPPEEIFSLFAYAEAKGLFPLCTPFDIASAKRLSDYGVTAYKTGSPDFTNHDLLRAIAARGKAIIVSTGMSDEREIKATNWLLRRLGAKYILLHCNSTYPTLFQDIQLRFMNRLGTAIYGYSGHERGIHVAIAAVARGAKVVEKHITLDRDMAGPDHKASLLPEEFREMVLGIREVEAALGSNRGRSMTQGERMNRANLAKSIIAKRDIAKEEIITEEMITVKSPGRGLQPNMKNKLLGRRARRMIPAGNPFYATDLLQKVVQPKAYRFHRPWGVPVRFHDFHDIMCRAHPDLVEFHMSYHDLDIDPATFFDRTFETELVVHSVDTFSDNHLLDLVASNEEYRATSIRNLQRCLDQARVLKQFFPQTPRPRVIVNAWGHTREGHIKPPERAALYDRVADSLSKLNQEGVEVIIQTMPPHGFLMGGQVFLNLFLDPQEIADFCVKYGYRICFDVSHSYLAANHLGRTLSEYVNLLGSHIAHIHLVDGAGVNEEGLQVGEGTVDFKQLAIDLNRLAPKASFIPEIWQGHENGGEGFWIALERLERWF
ncbi:MAG: N-acetylneuraminate synthase family protein [Patescibacteria group bacterium]